MKKLFVLSLALVIVIGIAGVATYAYFADTETSSNSRLVAGTLDLKTDDADGVSRTLYATSMSPGATAGPVAINLKNDGACDGAALDIVFSSAESDGSPNSVDKTADALAALMEVVALDYGGSSLLGGVTDVNGNGWKDVYDLKNSDLTGQSGIAASASRVFNIAVQLRSETANDFQADGIDITMTFTLRQ